MVALTAAAPDALQHALFAVTLLSALHILAPPQPGRTTPGAVQAAAFDVVKGALQGPRLASVMQAVVPLLATEEKERLRTALKRGTSTWQASGAEARAPGGPRINFSAFTAH